MYLRRLEIENTGPISGLFYDLPFAEDGRPKPVIFVGQNGSGKSIITSHIVNAIIGAKTAAHEDGDVEKGRVFKLRTPIYITNEAAYSRFRADFDGGLFQMEMQLSKSRSQFEQEYQYTSIDRSWQEIPAEDNSIYKSNFDGAATIEKEVNSSCLLYFPPNRFEEPAWLNQDNLTNYTSYSRISSMKGYSGRRVIQQAPLRHNQEWLLDVLFDALAIERKSQNIDFGNGLVLPVLQTAEGPASTLRAEIERFMLALLQKEGTIRWVVGSRGRRNISLTLANGERLSPNLFTLSTGQTAILNMFLTIMRDYDATGQTIKSVTDIKGIVVIDEIDAHLHTELQHNILPMLLETFPFVQFIVTTHSPLFILGMERRFKREGFEMIDLPSGQGITAERFGEFATAYGHFKDTTTYEQEVKDAIRASQKPILFVEGTIDIDLIAHAAIHLGQSDLLSGYSVMDANGFGGLDKLYKHFDTNVAKLLNQRVTLLYDCDVNKQEAQKDGVRRCVLPQQARRLSKGIENLFPDELIARAKEKNPAFIDVVPSYIQTIRGQEVMSEEVWSVNPDEKRNLATWIIANAGPDDFQDFKYVFEILSP